MLGLGLASCLLYTSYDNHQRNEHNVLPGGRGFSVVSNMVNVQPSITLWLLGK